MKTQFNIEQVIEIGEIKNELDFERALIADRKLRVLSKENPKLKTVRRKLRKLIEAYESKNWSSDSRISESMKTLILEDVKEFKVDTLKQGSSLGFKYGK